jgi:hypothetical protein
MEVLDISQLAQMIRKTRKSIASDMTRNPERIPPWFKLPGSKKPLWFRETVDAFVRKCAERADAMPSESTDQK